MNNVARFSLAGGCLMLGLAGGFFLRDRTDLHAQPEEKPPIVVPKESTSYRDLVKAVAPAVVSIEAKVKPKRLTQNGVVEEAFPAQNPKIEMQIGFGSGVIIDPKGVIVTNFHVVDGAESLEIRLADGRKYVGKDWRADRKTDLAIVRIEAEKPLPYLSLGDSDQMEVGDRVLAIGAPFGLTGTVTHGIISAKSRSLRLNQYEDFLQTDAAINPGNSGGPLVGMDGRVIGINSAIKTKSGGFQGVGLAISSNLTKTIVEQLTKEGAVKRGYLGLQIRDLDAETGGRLGLKEGSGVLVTRVFDQSPAFKSGLKLNDVVITIAGKPVRDGVELQKVVSALPLNQPVDVVLNREGKSLQLRLTIEEQPDAFGTK